jgi:hypothetical protein
MKETSINKMLLLILVAICIGIVIKELEYKRFERFNWSIGLIAEKGEVVEVYSCYFTNNYHYIEKERIMYDREKPDYFGYVSDSQVKKEFYPDSCAIQWFSYNDNKFYEANIPLSKKLVKRITEKLKADRQYKSADDITFYAKLKAKGNLTIGAATYDFHEEIISVQAHEIEIDWKKFKSYSALNRNEWVDAVVSRYNWNLVVDLPEKQTIDEIRVYTFANISYYSTDQQDTLSQATLKPIPSKICLWVISPQENKRTYIQTNLDDKEIYHDFSNLKKSEKTSILLQVAPPDRDDTQVDIFLKQGNRKIKLEQTSLEAF